MFVVGLTGGIASGKTTVAEEFAKKGIAIIDTDVIARKLVEPGQPAYTHIIKHFPVNILQANKRINRRKLREIIFNDQQERLWLENLLHPLIREEVAHQVARATSPYCIVVIPLLAETTPNPLINRILVVDVDEESQIQRIMERDNCTAEDAKKIIASQASRQQRLLIADDVITNDQDKYHLIHQVNKLDERYKKN